MSTLGKIVSRILEETEEQFGHVAFAALDGSLAGTHGVRLAHTLPTVYWNGQKSAEPAKLCILAPD